MHLPILEICKISKSFGGLSSLVEVDCKVDKNSIYAIIGPNGAGKTTLFNCISGFYKPDSGSVIFEGRDIAGWAPHRVSKIGIFRTFQNIGLFRNATVLENMLIGQHLNIKSGLIRGALLCKKARKEETQAKRKAIEQLEMFKIFHLLDERVSSLSFGVQRQVELARVLLLKPRLILLDEPTSGLNGAEKENFVKTLAGIKDRTDLTILIVEHDMKLIMEISDKICVLDYGKKIAEGRPEEIIDNEEVIRVYLGEENSHAHS